jgi:PAS domain S-box-containing protein
MIRWRRVVRSVRARQDTGASRDTGPDDTGVDEFRQYFERCPDPMWIYDLESAKILLVNAAAVDAYGYSKEEFLNMRVDELAPGEERERAESFPQQHLSGLRGGVLGWHRRKDGTLLNVETATNPVTYGGRPARLLVAHDMTERFAVERDLDRFGRVYRMLASLGRLVSKAEDDHAFLSGVCRVIVEEGGYALAWIGYAREGDDRRIEPVVVYGDHPEYIREIFVSWDIARPEGRGPAGTAVREARPVFIENIGHSREFIPWRERAQAHGYASCLALPFLVDPQTRGVICFYSRVTQAHDSAWLSLLEGLAREIANGVLSIRNRRALDTIHAVLSRMAAQPSVRDLRKTVKNLLRIVVELWKAELGVVIQLETSETDRSPQIFVAWGGGDDIAPKDLSFDPEPWEGIQSSESMVYSRARVRRTSPLFGSSDREIVCATVPIVGKERKPLGYLSLGFTEPLHDDAELAACLHLSASRLFSEFELWKLEHREVRTAQLLERVHNAVVVLDETNRISAWNTGAERIYGWSRHEAIGRGPELLVTDVQERHTILSAVESEGRWRGRTTVVTKLGETRLIELSVSSTRQEDNERSSVFVIGEDVTAQSRLEERLRHAERLEVIGQLTGGVAHDFNNLLTVILGNSELLVEKLSDRPAERELAGIVFQAAQQGGDLTQRLLAFARKQPLRPQTVSVNTVLTAWSGLIRRTLGSRIDVETIQGAGLWEVTIDPGQLEVALLNLCINARDAMPDGGRLTIETTNVWIDLNYADQYVDVPPGQYVLLSVSDTGVGIRPEDLPHVFEPFFTTKEPGKGTGLGLSMVYGFIKQSQGHIKIYSEPNKGTTVKMYLPKSGRREETRPQLPASAGALPARATILVVEDNDMIRRFAREQLTEVGYRVLEAANADDALNLLREEANIDLLFVDIVMPGGMNGKQLADLVRRKIPNVRILYTSGYTANAIIHQGRLDSGAYLLNKPYTRADLLRMIRRVFDEETHGDR